LSSATLHRPYRGLAHQRDNRLHGWVRGRAEDAPWVRPALIALLLGTAVAYTWNLSASGNANSFYAAAVQAGTKSWKAFFFGSLDSSSFITVDKPPASIWVMALSGRLFGFSSLSMLIPQALEGVVSVALLYAAVKRWFGAGTGLLAGALIAITPVAALMFRFNNPDALLVCLLVGAAYCLVRALEGASTPWILAAGTFIGFAFLAKMMQAFLVLPAFALVYMVAAPTGLRRRLWQTLVGGLAVVISAGWWVAIVALWPASSRPMIDGSSSNSILDLIVGYNGLGRIFGASGPSGGGGGGGGGNFSGQPGVLRLFNNLMGGQASWLIPAALLALVLGLWSTRGTRLTDRTRAAMLLWGGWLVGSGLVFSLASGIIHPYYTVALAPAVAALVAIGTRELWQDRERIASRLLLALGALVTSGWAWVMLDRTPRWEPWLRVAILTSVAIAVIGLLAQPTLRRLGRWPTQVIVALLGFACVSAPIAYTIETITSPQTGALVSAGPSSGQGFGGPGGNFGGGSQTSASSALVKPLEQDSGKYRWAAAVSGSETAASLELATGGIPVMAIGGFNGQGGNISLARFKQDVARAEIHYYVAGNAGGRGPFAGTSGRPAGIPGGGRGLFAGGGPGGMSSSSSAIQTWVKTHFKSELIGGQTVYDLTHPRES
jgi:4-amino-4-deoxy-L-arabinose transferase-like glycosyltransferase